VRTRALRAKPDTSTAIGAGGLGGLRGFKLREKSQKSW